MKKKNRTKEKNIQTENQQFKRKYKVNSIMKSMLGRRTLFTVLSHEAGSARALSRDVVAVSAVPTQTHLRAVLPIKT